MAHEQTIKKRVRERDGHRCRDCGVTESEWLALSGRRLSVHRLVPGAPYALDESCIALCEGCHARRHGRRYTPSLRAARARRAKSLRIFLAHLRGPLEPGICWDWHGGLNDSGYGQFGGHLAHRFAYERWRGPIPGGLTLDHLCRNRRCVNPAHLEPVTRRVNTLRGATLAAAESAREHCPAGHAYTSENTYVDPKRRRHCRTCSRRRTTVWYHAAGKEKRRRRRPGGDAAAEYVHG